MALRWPALGTLLLLKRKSICVILTMLKTVLTTENRLAGRIFQRNPSRFDTTGALIRASVFCFQETTKGGFYLKQHPSVPEEQTHKKEKSISRFWEKLYSGFIAVSLSGFLIAPAYAADTIWSKASEIMKDIYTQVLAISTIAAVVTASIALLLMNFSKNERSVTESRAWLKRIIITWAILNSLGFIMAYVTPFFSGGQYTA